MANETPGSGEDRIVARLGAHGEGILEGSGADVSVPFALPGERVTTGAGSVRQRTGPPSADRIAPVCPHFGTCGGCVAQHMSQALYARWKEAIVRESFTQRGLAAAAIGPLVPCPQASRRRAVLTAQRRMGQVAIGYHARRTHDLVSIQACPVLVPEITRAFGLLGHIVGALGVAEARLGVLASDTGLDVAVEADLETPPPAAASEIGRLAGSGSLARVSLNGAPLVQRIRPELDMGGTRVAPPPGAFVQAVAVAETALRERILAAVPKSKRVADLFCGLGAFTYPLARSTRVLAVDSDKPALAAMQEALRHARGIKPVQALLRDLFRDPLSPKELEDVDAVLLDPPRAGAQAQAQALARSTVPAVVYVSCNPATLARDVRLLVDGGYLIESVTPVDQFLYADHVEAICVLRRPGRKRKA